MYSPFNAGNKNKDWSQSLSEGDINGYSFIEKFGANPDIDTGTDPEDVWDVGGLYNFSSTADINKVASSDNNDTQLIEIRGLDENWLETKQTITLTGQTPVNLPTPLIRVFRMINYGATDLLGDLYCAIDTANFVNGVPDTITDIRAKIRIGFNQTLMAIYTIPANKKGYFYGGYLSMNKSTGSYATVDWRVRVFGSVFAVKGLVSLVGTGSGHFTYNPKFPIEIPPKADVLIRCTEVEANNIGVSAGFTIVLKDI